MYDPATEFEMTPAEYPVWMDQNIPDELEHWTTSDFADVLADGVTVYDDF